MITNNYTVFAVKITLELKKNVLFYIPIVSNQNNAKPIAFKFVSIENKQIIFENKEHDFPQRIIYSNPKSDSLYARLEGNDNGKFKKGELLMQRSKAQQKECPNTKIGLAIRRMKCCYEIQKSLVMH